MADVEISSITVRSPAEAKRAAVAHVLAKRDAIGAEVRERWPVLAEEIVSLLARLKAVDDEIRTVNGALAPADRLELVEASWRHQPERPGESIHKVPAFKPAPLYLATEIPALRPGDPSHHIHWSRR
jgi:hypothetical protein